MLQLKNLSYYIADKELFSELNWVINPGQHLALLGANGCGKTTLLRILTGEIKPKSGDLLKPNNYTIGYLPQEEETVGKRSLLREVLEGHQQVASL
jgi:ATPase subunit of ABC transporter with duplicated ATPase domains